MAMILVAVLTNSPKSWMSRGPLVYLGKITVPTTIGNPSQAYSYEYDLSGNCLQEQIDNSVTASSFNNLNQIVSQRPGGTMAFTGTVSEPGTLTVGGNAGSVDAFGNWTAAASVFVGANALPLVATDLNGNVANMTIDVTVIGGASRTITYDSNGNLLNNGAGQVYAWDAENRLVTITQTGGTTGFAYNGLGQRVQESLNGTVIKQWVWGSGSQPLEERNSSGSVTKRFYGSLGEQISGTNYYFTVDHLGSVREMVDSSGTTQARYSYDPFGRMTQVSGSLNADFGFTGDYYHAATGLSLTEFRVYDPNLGRWLSRDPMGEYEGIDLYGYVTNDPINWNDPFGLCAPAIGLGTLLVEEEAAGWAVGGNFDPVVDIAIIGTAIGGTILIIETRAHGQGERNWAGSGAGSGNKYKGARTDKDNPDNWVVKDPRTGKWIKKGPKPPDFPPDKCKCQN
jgi:RHS repeat-associated protein